MASKNGFYPYFKGLLNGGFRVPLALSLVAMLVTWITSSGIGVMTTATSQSVIKTGFGYICYIGLHSAMIAAVLAFARFKRRINLDMLLSLPVSKGALRTAHYLYGLINTLLPVTVGYICNMAVLAVRVELTGEQIGLLLLYYAFVAVYSTIFYTVFVFVFNEANTVFDGCAFILLWYNVFYFVGYSRAKDSINAHLLSPEYYAERITRYFENAINGVWKPFAEFFGRWRPIAVTSLWVAIGVLAAVLLVIRFGKRQYERAGEVSNSIFGYNTLIPIYALAGSVYGYSTSPYNSMGTPLEILQWFLTASLLYVIFRRGIKLKVTDYTVLGVLAVLFLTRILMEFQR